MKLIQVKNYRPINQNPFFLPAFDFVNSKSAIFFLLSFWGSCTNAQIFLENQISRRTAFGRAFLIDRIVARIFRKIPKKWIKPGIFSATKIRENIFCHWENPKMLRGWVKYNFMVVFTQLNVSGDFIQKNGTLPRKFNFH